MGGKMLHVRLHHPLYDTVLELTLPASTTFGEILKVLYQNGFIQKKAADYGFIVNRRLCALNKPLESYVPLQAADTVEIEINGLLTIMT
jgi:ribosomal protein S8